MFENIAENITVFVGGLTGTLYVWASVDTIFNSFNHIFEGAIYACITTFIAYGTKEVCKRNWNRWFGSDDDNTGSGDAPFRSDKKNNP